MYTVIYRFTFSVSLFVNGSFAPFCHFALCTICGFHRAGPLLYSAAGRTPCLIVCRNHPVAASPDQGEFVTSLPPAYCIRSCLLLPFSSITCYCAYVTFMLSRHNALLGNSDVRAGLMSHRAGGDRLAGRLGPLPTPPCARSLT